MKIRNIVAAAGLVIAAMGISGEAQARPHDGDRWQSGYHDNGRHRGWDNRRHWQRTQHYRGYRGRHYRPVRHCWTEWRHHRRVRVCR